MELKAMEEYKSPEYPTTNESKNKALMMMVRTGKISLGVAVMCLLCNCSWANVYEFLPSIYVGELENDGLVEDLGRISTYGFGRTACLVGIIVSALVTIFLAVKSTRKYKICEDIEEKHRLLKKRNKTLIKGSVVIASLILLIIILNIIERLIFSI